MTARNGAIGLQSVPAGVDLKRGRASASHGRWGSRWRWGIFFLFLPSGLWWPYISFGIIVTHFSWLALLMLPPLFGLILIALQHNAATETRPDFLIFASQCFAWTRAFAIDLMRPCQPDL